MSIPKCRYRVPAIGAGYDKTPTNSINLGIFVHSRQMGRNKVRDLARKASVQPELKASAGKHLMQFVTSRVAIYEKDVRNKWWFTNPP